MESKKQKYNIVAIIAGGLILLGAVVFVAILLTGTSREAEVIFTGDSFEITGQFGISYDLNEITDISLENDIPPVGLKLNGAGLGDIKKGDWEVEGLGRCRLFIHTENGPYVFLLTENGYVIINFEDAEKTKELYQEFLSLKMG